MQRLPFLFVAESENKGRGVFTGKPIKEGDLIEICPVIVLPRKEMKIIDKTVLYNYYFLWGKKQRKCAICLGYGSIYNHAYHPNARYELDIKNKTIDFFCIKDIPAGAEITVNYNGEAGDEKLVWFDKKND